MANKMSGAPARLFRALAAVSVAIGIAAKAPADFINISSDTAFSHAGIGSFTGTINYVSQLGGSAGTLLITLTNTSTQFGGGYITGFVFNFDSDDPHAKAKLASAPQRFQNAANRVAGPFGGPFDAGAALRGRIMGGGHYTKGIASGDTKIFEFDVTAADAGSLNAADFMRGTLPFNFVVRFRGFQGGGADLVPAEGSSIPGPSVLVAMAIFTALICWRKRQPA